MREEFQVHLLNEVGLERANKIAEAFSNLLTTLETDCGITGREGALVKTKLQEAAFWAKRAMAVNQENQKK